MPKAKKQPKKEPVARGERQKHSTVTAASAGCSECEKSWKGANAVSCAARHHDSSGHSTWAEQVLYTEYGEKKAAPAEPAAA